MVGRGFCVLGVRGARAEEMEVLQRRWGCRFRMTILRTKELGMGSCGVGVEGGGITLWAAGEESGSESKSKSKSKASDRSVRSTRVDSTRADSTHASGKLTPKQLGE